MDPLCQSNRPYTFLDLKLLTTANLNHSHSTEPTLLKVLCDISEIISPVEFVLTPRPLPIWPGTLESQCRQIESSLLCTFL